MQCYALVSMVDEVGNEWVYIGNPLDRVSAVQNFPWAKSGIPHRAHSHVMDSDAEVLEERAELSQNRPDLNVSNIMEIVARRHVIWPLAGEAAKSTVNGRNGCKRSGEWGKTRQNEQFRKGEQGGYTFGVNKERCLGWK